MRGKTAAAALAVALAAPSLLCAWQEVAPPTGVRADDVSGFQRREIRVRWQLPEGERSGLVLERSVSGGEFERLALLPPVAREYVDVVDDTSRQELLELEDAKRNFTAFDRNGDGALLDYAGESLEKKREQDEISDEFAPVLLAADGDGDGRVTGAEIEARLAARTIASDRTYSYRLRTQGSAGALSVPSSATPPLAAERGALANLQWRTAHLFDWGRAWFLVVMLTVCCSVIYFILQARAGKPLRIRKIAGLEAVDEAVGRATEMGRSCLFIPGIQDMNEIQTIAGITVLSRVARTAAEYDAKVEVPTSRSLVMTTARETVQAAYLSAGRPEAYNQDHIYYVTDEQFGFVAYLSGLMVREKPAACFYMGAFFAESLILAETGNSIGAIQVAGTAMPAQLPFFVAACDYTLIGEEFFAASAYLSGSPEELGSLKGQDVGKVLVAAILVVGCGLATIATLTGSEAIGDLVTFITKTVLS